MQVDETTLPAGMMQTTNPVIGGSDFGNQSQPYRVTLGAGEENLTADFGYNWGDGGGLGAIGDRVWIDVNGDGVQDPGEIGVANVKLNLITAGSGRRVRYGGRRRRGDDVTDADGNYIFDGLPAGAYEVEVDPSNCAGGRWRTTRRRVTRTTSAMPAGGAGQPDHDAGGAGAGRRLPECGLRLPAAGRPERTRSATRSGSTRTRDGMQDGGE